MKHGNYKEGHQGSEEGGEEGREEGREEARPRRTGSQVRRQVAQDLGLPKSLVREVVEAYVAGIAQGIAEGEEVCIEGLGSFQARKVRQEAVVVCHPKGKDRRVYRTEASVRVRFHRSPKLGRVLRERWLTDRERGR